jgi:hypothetical protein
LPILSVTTKISEESFVINPIPDMGTVLLSELRAILAPAYRDMLPQFGIRNSVTDVTEHI